MISIDLAKSVFLVHEITTHEEELFNQPLRRLHFLPFFAEWEPGLTGMKACSNARIWARELTARGHQVRQSLPIYVTTYIKRGKFDAVVAEEIGTAVTCPTIRYVQSKGSSTERSYRCIESVTFWFVQERN